MTLRIGKRSQLKNNGFTPPFLIFTMPIINYSFAKPLPYLLNFWRRFCRQKLVLGRAGFTFIELVLVTIIILVLVGISTPFFRKPFSSIQLKNTCQNLVQLMRYAQAKAIAERRFCRINFDFEKGTFWASVESEAAPGEFERIKGRWGRSFKVPEDISIGASGGTSISGEASFVSFYPDGSCDKAEIRISNEKGKAFAITMQRTIGYVELEK